MSSSEPKAMQSGVIEVAVPLGVEVKILDGNLSTVGSPTVGDGMIAVRETLPAGIYTVRWIIGDRSEQKTVRLRDGDKLALEPDNFVPGAAVSEDAALAERQFKRLAEMLAQPVTDTELIVFVCANDFRTSADVAGNVALRAIDNGPGRSTRVVHARYRAKNAADGWGIRRYMVPPGAYLLHFLSAERVTLEQTVHVAEGRRTVAWLRYGRAAKTEMRKGDTRFASRRGIDAPRSRVLSFGSTANERELQESFQLADVILPRLASRAGELDPTLVEGLRSNTDPYLRLYAAAVLITRPLRDTLLWLDAPPDAAAMWVPPGNLSAARALLDPLFALEKTGMWPDLLCARWRIALAQGERDFVEAVAPLTAPPMLESSWRWAAAWSIEQPVIDLINTPGLQAVAIGQERSVPWLTWRALDTRRRVDELPTSQAANEEIVGGLRAISEISSQLGSQKLVNEISPKTLDLMRTIQRIGGQMETGESGGLINRLAGATGLPGATLSSAVEVALQELQSGTSENAVLSSDPHKGKFGSLSERDGYRVFLLSYEPTNSSDFLALNFVVEGVNAKTPLEGVVTFYLHPTYNPAVQVAGAVGGKANFTCYAWGAFTLGVETATGVRLELDLAQDMRLPQFFRDR